MVSEEILSQRKMSPDLIFSEVGISVVRQVHRNMFDLTETESVPVFNLRTLFQSCRLHPSPLFTYHTFISHFIVDIFVPAEWQDMCPI